MNRSRYFRRRRSKRYVFSRAFWVSPFNMLNFLDSGAEGGKPWPERAAWRKLAQRGNRRHRARGLVRINEAHGRAQRLSPGVRSSRAQGHCRFSFVGSMPISEPGDFTKPTVQFRGATAKSTARESKPIDAAARRAGWSSGPTFTQGRCSVFWCCTRKT